MKVNIIKVDPDDNRELPTYATNGSSGIDLRISEDTVIPPKGTKAVPTGYIFNIPEGFEMQIRPRSGLTLRSSLRVHFGTVDSDYTGEVMIIVENTVGYGVSINRGDKIAQAIFAKVEKAELVEATDSKVTDRGDSGFGSTGV